MSPKEFQIGDVIPTSVYIAAKFPGDPNGSQNVMKRFRIEAVIKQSGTRCSFMVRDLATDKTEQRGWSMLSLYVVERPEAVQA